MATDHITSEIACPSCGSGARIRDGRCTRCMADLTSSCPGCRVPALRLARFCWSCGATLLGDGGAGLGRAATARRPVTIMFCDLVGSSALSVGMDPEDFGEVLRAYHTLVTDIVASCNGFTARYVGDGTLAFFGYPQSGEDDAERAIRAGLAVIQAIPQLRVFGRPMQVRVGIAAGVVVVGDLVGTRVSSGPDIAGEAANLAARLQHAAEPDTVLVDAAVHALARLQFEFIRVDELELKGWAGLVSAWRVVRPAAADGEPHARSGGPVLPLVGRDAEASLLRALWQDAASGRGRVAVLVGEMGIGKSRLVAELLRTTAEKRCARHLLFCSQYLDGIPLHPVVRHVEILAGFTPEDPPLVRRKKLGACLTGVPEMDRALITELIVPGAAPPLVAGLSPNKRRDMTLGVLLGLTRARAAGLPILTVFEDYHWADPTSRELLSLAAEQVPTMAGLLIVTVRPGSEPDWMHHPWVERIELEALKPADATSLAKWAAAETPLPHGTVEDIVSRCDGVPLFIEEVTRAMVEGSSAGMPRLGQATPMPLSIHASLMSRLDSLGAARETAEVASVIGRAFAPELLAQVMERSDAELRVDLDQMVSSGLVRRGGDGEAAGFRFKHALIQDAAYDGVVRERRRVVHGRIGRAMRDLAPIMAETQPQLLARHFTEAGDVREAVAWWLAAATRSLQQSAVIEALEQLSRGMDLLAAEPDSEWRRRSEMALLICRARAHAATSGHGSEAAGVSFRHARQLCDSLPDAPQRLTVMFGEWSHLVTRGPLKDAARLADEIRALAEQTGDPAHHLFGCYMSGMTDTVMGRFKRARAYLEQGIDACIRKGSASYGASVVGDPKAVMRSYLALIDMCQDELEQSRRNSDLALDEAHETKLTYSVALTLLVRVVIEAFGGAPDEGDGALDALRSFARDHRMAFFESIEIPLRGWAVARRGDAETGLALLREGAARYRETQSGVWVWTFLRMEAEVLGWTGRIAEGLAILNEADITAAQYDAEFEASVLARVRGELLARAGRREEALDAFSRALKIAEQAGAQLFARQAGDARSRLLAAPPSRMQADLSAMHFSPCGHRG